MVTPHGGLALGLDRLVMILAGKVIFAKSSLLPGTVLVLTSMLSPSLVDQRQSTKELHLNYTNNR